VLVRSAVGAIVLTLATLAVLAVLDDDRSIRPASAPGHS
jgi:hypothetical protein